MRILKRGSRGRDVRTLQGLLNQLGNRLVVDGIFGGASEDAVEDFQRFSGLTATGVVDDQTWAALQQRAADGSDTTDGDTTDGILDAGPAMARIFDRDDFSRQPTWDSHTDRRIGKLHPRVQSAARQFIILLERDMGKTVRVTSGFRSFAEQDALFAQGRTAPGRRVTNAPAGRSYHNYGVAFDVVEIRNGKALWDNPDWSRIADLGIELGFEWGGNWSSFKDRPHFQMTFGKSTSDLLSLHQAGRLQDGFVIVD